MTNKHKQAFFKLQQRLQYKFDNEKLLVEAMSHSSNERRVNNELLEFLGDGVLNLVIAEYIMDVFPKAGEGQLSRIRAQLVCKSALAKVGQLLMVSDAIILGPSEARGGSQQRASIIADGVEAIIGAVFKDSDFNTAKACILRWFEPLLEGVSLQLAVKDPKTQLQEFCQQYKYGLPCYQLLEETQANNEPFFEIYVNIKALEVDAKGEGSSRKKAEQAAASALLSQLNR